MSPSTPLAVWMRAACALLGLTLLGGCRSTFAPGWESFFPAESEQADVVADDLRGVNWIANRHWTPESSAESAMTRWQPAPRGRSRETSNEISAPVEAWPPVEVAADPAPERFGLTELLEASPERLRRWVADDGLVGWNAAILLAVRSPEHADADVERILRRLVTERPRFDPATGESGDTTRWLSFRSETEDEGDAKLVRVSESMQSAAAEAWVVMRGRTAADPIEALAEIGRLLEQRTLPLHVRGEFYRGIARWVEPANVPHLPSAIGEEAREHASAELRRAAVEACVVHAARHRADDGTLADSDCWLLRLEEMETDPDAGVRAAFGHWVALVRAPDAVDVLRRQLDDTSPRVRDSAIGSLAALPAIPGSRDSVAEEALDELTELGRRSEPRIRALAVGALARVSTDAVFVHVEDESALVRRAVAESLAESPSNEACRILIDLASDRSLQVEAAAVDAVVTWPDALAAPVLLHAMELGRSSSRTLAASALRRRVEGTFGFPEFAPIVERRRHLAELCRRFGLSRTPPPAGQLDSLAEERRERDIASDLADVGDSAARPVALERLRTIDEAEVALLERLLVNTSTEVQTIVAREVLPEISLVYAALDAMERGDRRERIEAARRLSRLAVDTSLSPFVMRRLHEIVVSDVADRDVWRAVLEAIGRDGGEDAARIVQLALGFRWPDVQRLACASIETNPRPRHAMWLVPLLENPDRSVRIAAIRAAGRCGNPAVVEGVRSSDGRTRIGLRPLLRDEDVEVRNEAAIALATLGDPDGLREVDRLAHSPEPNVRRDAVRAMVRSGNLGFVDLLVDMGENDRSPRVRRDALAALATLVPESEQPVLPPTTRAPEAAARAWADWWQRRSRLDSRSRTTALQGRRSDRVPGSFAASR